jgi:6-phosphogluconolactonase (cycloisomerase 2 family)
LVVLDQTGDHLYIINEVQPLDERAIGHVTSFATDRSNGALRRLGEISSFGLSPCYIGSIQSSRKAS